MTSNLSIRRLTRAEWGALAPQFRDLSFRQCGAYAEAAARDVGATSEFVSILRGRELIGLANVRVKRMPLLPLGVAYVNHGPLTARGDGFSPEVFGCCLEALRQEYVHARRLLLRIAPPSGGGKDVEAQAACLGMHGLRPCGRHKPHETFVLDLEAPLAAIRNQFDKKWRSCLSKAERSNLEITRSENVDDFVRFEAIFRETVERKGFYTRQDAAFFRKVRSDANANERLVAHLAWSEGELVAGHIGSFVGDTAVYLLGAANAKGRDRLASYLLQWTVIQHAKSSGNRFYDLGGIDQAANPDVYRFKKRLNGRHLAMSGPYELATARSTKFAINMLEDARAYLKRKTVGLTVTA